MDIPRFTIIDLETTGLFPGGNDRIVEIAMVSLDPEGNITDSFCTLVNPERDVGPTHIHGISAAEVLNAPKFSDVAGYVAETVRGSIPVAHNATFDRRFIAREFQRLSSSYSIDEIPWLCTLRGCSTFCDDLGGRSLMDCCHYFDIELVDAHSALADATATAHILAGLISLLRNLKRERELLIQLGDVSSGIFLNWPTVNSSFNALTREVAKVNVNDGKDFIRQLLENLPGGRFSLPVEQEYLDLLDRVLEDRRVTEDEYSELVQYAADLNLSEEQVEGIHECYMRDLFLAAWADHRITEHEHQDLEKIKQILHIEPEVFERLSNETEAAVKRGKEVKLQKSREDLAGKSVCFSGEFQSLLNGERFTRKKAEELASDYGMIVQRGATKKLDMLVLADPDSQSGKAKKARQYGTRLITDAAFLRILGVG